MYSQEDEAHSLSYSLVDLWYNINNYCILHNYLIIHKYTQLTEIRYIKHIKYKLNDCK